MSREDDVGAAGVGEAAKDSRDELEDILKALEAGDSFIESHLDFVKEFNNYRGDILSSDREVVAFMFALESMEVA